VQIEKPEEWATRIRILKEQIQYWSENVGDKTVEVVELFYVEVRHIIDAQKTL
jgi:hypothetical protein